ncbi:MAG TPA: hypothetical protein PKE55_02990 [Kiritimatiellia bacterium]|nr:hypothetical protein [Kiritimatiellia bacterium]
MRVRLLLRFLRKAKWQVLLVAGLLAVSFTVAGERGEDEQGPAMWLEWRYLGVKPEGRIEERVSLEAEGREGMKALMVGPLAEDQELDWAAWVRLVPGKPGDVLEASVEVQVEEVAARGDSICRLELRLEYFADEEGMVALPTRAGVSFPLIVEAGMETGRWRKVQARQRIPEDAVSVKVYIVALMAGAGGEVAQVFWLKRPRIEVQPGLRRERMR